MNNSKKVTEAILKGTPVREALAGKDDASKKLTESDQAIVSAIKEALGNEELEHLYAWAENNYDDVDPDMSDEELIEKYGDEYAEVLIDFVKEQISEKYVWSAYFPDFCSAPYWYTGFNKDGAVCDSGCGEFTKDWIGDYGSVEEDRINESGGGDYSEVSTGNCNADADDIKAMAKIVDATGSNDDDAWCIYKGSLKYWLAGDCTDNTPEIGINSGAELYFKDLSISNTSPSNVKKGLEIIKKHYDAVSDIDLWPGETLKGDNEEDKAVVQAMVDELETAGLKVENNF